MLDCEGFDLCITTFRLLITYRTEEQLPSTVMFTGTSTILGSLAVRTAIEVFRRIPGFNSISRYKNNEYLSLCL